MVRKLGMVALVLGAAAGCGAPAERSGALGDGPGEAAVWVDVGCSAQDVDPQQYFHSSAEGGGIPGDFSAVAVVRCRNVVREVAGEGAWTVQVTERADGAMAPLVEALRQQSEPPPGEQIACPAIGYSLPYFVLVGADGRALLPAVPTEVCGKPLGEVTALLDALPYRTVAETRVALHKDPSSPSGCYDVRKDTITHSSPEPGPAKAVWSADHVLVCLYTVTGADGQLERGYLLSGQEASALTAALGAAGPAAPCDEPHTRFAVLSVGSGPSATVELDGCFRLHRPDDTLGQLDEDAVAGLTR